MIANPVEDVYAGEAHLIKKFLWLSINIFFFEYDFKKRRYYKLLADKYVLDQNFNDKSSNEDWEEFTARKMKDAFMAGYKEGKESK